MIGLQMLVYQEVVSEDLLSGLWWAFPTPTMPFAFFAILFSSLFPHNLLSQKHQCPLNPLPNVIVTCGMRESTQLCSSQGNCVLCHHQAFSKPWSCPCPWTDILILSAKK